MYLILIALALLLAYSGLLILESYRGQRYLEMYRARLDHLTSQAGFVLQHVDFGSFAREEAVRLAHRAVHSTAHLTLRGVRAAERLLTRLVRRLRLHPETVRPAGESTRSFVRTLSEFKGQLEASRPVSEQNTGIL